MQELQHFFNCKPLHHFIIDYSFFKIEIQRQKQKFFLMILWAFRLYSQPSGLSPLHCPSQATDNGCAGATVLNASCYFSLEITKINEQKNALMITENLIKTKGFEDLIIFINDDSINVIIKKEKLSKEDTAQIQSIIAREMNAKIANIHIMTNFLCVVAITTRQPPRVTESISLWEPDLR